MKNIWKIVMGLVFASAVVAGCDDDYLVDGGKSNPLFDGNVMEFLEAHPEYFTKLVEVVRLAEMEDVLRNERVTFFAPPDPSIERSVNMLSEYVYRQLGQDRITSLDQIDPEVWREFLSMYVVRDKYLLKDIPQVDTTRLDAYGGQAFLTYDNTPMNLGVVYHDYVWTDGNTNRTVQYAGYRQLIISYVNDFVTKDMVNAYVTTSDIQPDNGAVHVLRYSGHYFGFDVGTFAAKAMSAGIKTASQP